jgi:ribonuclease HII
MTDAAAKKKRNKAAAERRRLVRLNRYEDEARARGFQLIGGVDEVGRGPLAGPVVAACVVVNGPLMLKGLNDSKQVKPELRVELAETIKSQCVAWGVGVACVAEIDRLNIYWASILAMERAIEALSVPPAYLLTDAVRIKSFTGGQEPVIKGDAKCASVAAASIVAKVYRDALLVTLDAEYPHYGFAEHKGYGTPRHLEALREHGPCDQHRRAWWRIREALALPGILEPDLAEALADEG